MRRRLKPWGLPLLVALVLTLVYQFNVFRTADETLFLNYQVNSEAFVVAGMVESNAYGFSKLGLQRLGALGTPTDTIPAPFHALDGSLRPVPKWPSYVSQVGLQGYAYALVYKATGITNVGFYRGIGAALLGLVLTALLVLLRREFGLFPAGVVFLALITAPWFVVFGRNIYWVPFTWFLPLLAVASYTSGLLRRRAMLSLVYIGALVKCLCGYELLSALLIMTLAPLVYVAALRRASLRDFIRRLLTPGAVFVGGFVSALIIHAFLLDSNPIKGLDIIRKDVELRTYGNAGAFDPVWKQSLQASPFHVLKTYLWDWTQPVFTGSTIPFALLLAALLAGSIALIRRSMSAPRLRALAWVFLWSLLSPLSWYLLAKSHAAAHPHIDFVIWYLPTMFAGALLVGAWLNDVWNRLSPPRAGDLIRVRPPNAGEVERAQV